jgi:hypothetical protein
MGRIMNVKVIPGDKLWPLFENEHSECIKKGTYQFRHVAPLAFACLIILGLGALSSYGIAADALAKHAGAWTVIGSVGLGVTLIFAIIEGKCTRRVVREHNTWKRKRIELEKGINIGLTDAEITRRLAIENKDLRQKIIASLSKEEALLHLEYLREWIQDLPKDETEKGDQLHYHSLMLELYDKLREGGFSVAEGSFYFLIAKEQVSALKQVIDSSPPEEIMSELQAINKKVHSHICFFLTKADFVIVERFLCHPGSIRLSHNEYIGIFRSLLPENQRKGREMAVLLGTIQKQASELRTHPKDGTEEDSKAYKMLFLQYAKYLSFDDFEFFICKERSLYLPPTELVNPEIAKTLSIAFEEVAGKITKYDRKEYVENFAQTAGRCHSSLDNADTDIQRYTKALDSTLAYVTPMFRIEQGIEGGCYYSIRNSEKYAETTSGAYLYNQFFALSEEEKKQLLDSLEGSRKIEFMEAVLQDPNSLLDLPQEPAKMIYEKMTPTQLVNCIQGLCISNVKELDFIDEEIFASSSPATLKEMLDVAIQEKNLLSALLVGKLLNRYINREVARGEKRHTIATMQQYFFRVPEGYRDVCLGMLSTNIHLRKRLGFEENNDQITVATLRTALEKECAGFFKKHRSKTTENAEQGSQKRAWFSKKPKKNGRVRAVPEDNLLF